MILSCSLYFEYFRILELGNSDYSTKTSSVADLFAWLFCKLFHGFVTGVSLNITLRVQGGFFLLLPPGFG